MKSFKEKMKGFSLVEILILVVVVVCLSWGLLFVSGEIKMAKVDPAMAAVTIPSPASPGYMMTVLPVPGSYTTGSITNKVRFKMPWPTTLLGFQAICRTTGGGTFKADLLVNGVSYLTTPLSFKATTPAEGVLASTSIAAGSIISVHTTATGSTWTDPTFNIFFKRK
jgi:hypothetical protein